MFVYFARILFQLKTADGVGGRLRRILHIIVFTAVKSSDNKFRDDVGARPANHFGVKLSKLYFH